MPVEITENIYTVVVQEAAAPTVEVTTPGPSGAGVPPGGAEGSVLTKLSATDQDVDWVDYAYSGYSQRFGANFSSTDLDDTLAKILNITYAGPLVSLTAAGSTTIREKGTAVTSVLLTAATTKRSNDIAEVRFYKGASLIDTISSPTASGGSETYTWTGSFSDNTTFSVEVDDVSGGGGPTTATDSKTFTFVYPYYVGAGASGLSASSVAGLTKLTQASSATVNRTITAGAGEVFYFAYPASYGALTSILDVNNFETISDWTLRTEDITGLDGNPVSYRIYEFNNPVTAGDYYYSFRR